jgi:hypothetical protein
MGIRNLIVSGSDIKNSYSFRFRSGLNSYFGFEVVHDGNDELTVRHNIFQLGELVDPYRVAPSNDLKKKFKISLR